RAARWRPGGARAARPGVVQGAAAGAGECMDRGAGRRGRAGRRRPGGGVRAGAPGRPGDRGGGRVKVDVSLFGAFRELDPGARVELEVPEAARVADLRAALDAQDRKSTRLNSS